MDNNLLTDVADWAESRLATGEEPLWTFYKLEKLAEIARELSVGAKAVKRTERPLQSAEHSENLTRREGNIVALENFRCRPDDAVIPPLPT